MNPHLAAFILSSAVTAISIIVIAMLLTALPRFGALGARFAAVATRAPLPDVWVASLTWVPWVIGAVVCGWLGFAGAIVGQMIGLGVWCFVHESMHREAARGPRIVKVLNRTGTPSARLASGNRLVRTANPTPTAASRTVVIKAASR